MSKISGMVKENQEINQGAQQKLHYPPPKQKGSVFFPNTQPRAKVQATHRENSNNKE
jgi:hypothetical protein